MMRGVQPERPKVVIEASKTGDRQSKAAKEEFIERVGKPHHMHKVAVRYYIETNQANPRLITGMFVENTYNALYEAVRNNADVEMVSILLDAGFQVDEMCHLRKGCTALMCAAEYGKLGIAQLLLDRGANVLLVDNKGKTAEQLAAENQQPVIADLLKRRREELTEVKKTPTRADDLAEMGIRDAKVDELFCCPLSQRVMQEPMTVSTGATYDRTSLIAAFLQAGNPEEIQCVVTSKRIFLRELDNGVNITLNALIKKYVRTEIMAAEIAQGGPEIKNESAALPSQAGLFAPGSNIASSSSSLAVNAPPPSNDEELVGPALDLVAVTIHPSAASWPRARSM